ncbi:MAG: site-2 protease family protein [Phycisphaerales bacterium]|nr:MAG: site-2 protease family protein [Phycisphaerales bacterium]
MSWKDRDEYGRDPSDRLGRPGGDWRGVRPTIDNPMTWSLRLGRVWGIAVRVHVVFLAYILVQLARSIGPPGEGDTVPLGPGLAITWMAALFVVVLLHEFGHCAACRRTGGAADEILMWPLGGLAYCQPPNQWRAHLITVVGGPLVNAVICLILGPVLGLLAWRVWEVAVPNPLGPLPLDVLMIDGQQPWWLVALFALHHVSFLLLLFNLLPVFPLDGGRIAQSLLWARLGYVRSMRWAVRVGYFGAIAMGLFGAIVGNWLLIGIAIFGGITCYFTHKQMEWTQAMLGFEDDSYALSLQDDPEKGDRRPSRAERKAARKADQQTREEAMVDQILTKIGSGGMESLSSREKRLLKQASRRKQRGE